MGFVLAAGAIVSAVRQYALADVGDYLRQTLYLTLICAVCRSLPVFLSNNKAMDLSVISILMTYLTMGTAQAITVFTLSTFFTFSFNEQGGKRVSCIYNSDPVKVAVQPWQRGHRRGGVRPRLLADGLARGAVRLPAAFCWSRPFSPFSPSWSTR